MKGPFWLFLLAAGAAFPLMAEPRRIEVTVTERAARAQPENREFHLIPYVLRIEGVQLPGDRASNWRIFGEIPAKDAPELGAGQGIGYRGGPKLAAPRDFAIALNQETRRYLTGKRRVTLWIDCDCATDWTHLKAVIDLSEVSGTTPGAK